MAASPGSTLAGPLVKLHLSLNIYISSLAKHDPLPRAPILQLSCHHATLSNNLCSVVSAWYLLTGQTGRGSELDKDGVKNSLVDFYIWSLTIKWVFWTFSFILYCNSITVAYSFCFFFFGIVTIIVAWLL